VWLSSFEQETWKNLISFDSFDLKIRKESLDITWLIPPEIVWKTMIRESTGARGYQQHPAWFHDSLNLANDHPPIPDVLQHFGRDHQIERVLPETRYQFSRIAHRVHTRTLLQIDANVSRRLMRGNDRPDRPVNVERSYFENSSADHFVRLKVSPHEFKAGFRAHNQYSNELPRRQL